MNDGKPVAGDPFSIEMPEPFRVAVTAFADTMSVDSAMLLAGARFEVEGVGFWVQHHGALDPGGMVLLAEIGSFQADLIAEPLAALLTQNTVFPSALTGYFGMLPETKTLVHCLRIDLEVAGERGGEAIASSVYHLSQNLKSALSHVAQFAPGNSATPSTAPGFHA